jgi:hypothetical protein
MSTAAAQSWDQSALSRQRWIVYLLPSLTDFAFILPIFLLFGLAGGTERLLSDGDTGWHIRTGEWILQHRSVPVSDFFSFTKFGQPWFAWEWGCDVIFALLHQACGLSGVVFLSVVLLALTFALLFRLVRRISGNDILALLVTALAMSASTMHWLARPHLFSWLLTVLFLRSILLARQGNKRQLLFLPGLTIVWVNLHGGFFIGIVLLTIAGSGEALSALKPGVRARDLFKAASPYMATALSCVLATFINPYGWRLHQHVFAYIRDSKLLDGISEFQSINFHNPGMLLPELMLFLGIAAAFWCLQRRDITPCLWIMVWTHAALYSVRNLPLFLLVSAAYVPAMVSDTAERFNSSRTFRKFRIIAKSVCSDFQPLERLPRSHVASLAALLLVGWALDTGMPGFRGEFSGKNFPVQAIPTLRRARFSHLFTIDQWADYVLYRLYPNQRVFVDGRSDLFGSAQIQDYARILGAYHDVGSQLRNYAIDGVMVKPDSSLATVLKMSPDWRLIFDDGTAVIFRTKSVDNNCGNSHGSRAASPASE